LPVVFVQPASHSKVGILTVNPSGFSFAIFRIASNKFVIDRRRVYPADPAVYEYKDINLFAYRKQI